MLLNWMERNQKSKIVQPTTSRKLKSLASILTQDIVVKDYQAATLPTVAVRGSIKMGVLSNLTSPSIAFGENGAVEIQYYKGPMLPLVISGVIDNPKFVKLSKSANAQDAGNYPLKFRIFEAANVDAIDFTDFNNNYVKKLEDGYLIASYLPSDGQGGNETPTPKPVLSLGAAIGVGIGCAVFVIVLIVIICCCCCKKKFSSSSSSSNQWKKPVLYNT